MKKITLILYWTLLSINLVYGQWPMSNDLEFDSSVDEPVYLSGKGPRILLDGAHHNFFIQWNFIKPFSDLAKEDGYQTVIDSLIFTPEYLVQFDIVMIITALPFYFTTKTEVIDESTFTLEEINNLYDWVEKGGSLLVFSEHAPFDQTINPLLSKFGIESSIGYTVDPENHMPNASEGWIVFSNENGLLNTNHPIVKGRNESEKINRLATFGGSSISGDVYINILKLSETAQVQMHSTGVGPSGTGDSQAIAGKVGIGKVVALGDANGFTAMLFERENKDPVPVGMNVKGYDWKQFVLNILHWLSNIIE
jgi:hypothetical protein